MPVGIYPRKPFTEEHKRKIGEGHKGQVPWNKGKKNFREFKRGEEHYNYGKYGENAPNWKGGRKKNKRNYIFLYLPHHPKSDRNGYIQEHRIIMEKYLERYLNPEEVVHHINGIRDDNRIENLMLFENDREHRKYHDRQRGLLKIN